MAEQKKVLISVPASLLEQLDDTARKNGSSRNEAVRSAIREYVAQKRRQEIAVRLKEGYAAMAAINSEWAAMCFEADSECVFGYEEKLAESE